MVLEDNKTLKSILNKETYTKLAHFCHVYNMHLKQLEHFKPSFIALMLTVSELNNIGVRQVGVDKYFELQALNDGKKIGKLESVDEQLKYITSMGLGNENSFINHSLDDLKKLKTLFEDLIIAWKKGDENKLYELFVKDIKENYPTVYNKLLVERNNNWMPIIENMFNTKETEFVLVGAAHLLGKEGVIEQLKNKGYKVTKFK